MIENIEVGISMTCLRECKNSSLIKSNIICLSGNYGIIELAEGP